MRRITAEDVSRYDEDGFVVFDQILDKDQVSVVRTASDRVHRGHYTHDRRPAALRRPVHHFGRDNSIRWYLNARLLDGDLWATTSDPDLAEAAASFLRSGSLSVLEDQLLDKPGPGLPCNFHQDYGYWQFSPSTQMITCWIALVDMTVELGPLQLIPGSHRWGYTANPRELIVGSEETWLEAVHRARRPGDRIAEPVTACVQAGGGVFFDSLTFHGSARNTTHRPRRAFSIHWAGEQCSVDRSKLAEYTYPYVFSGIPNRGRVVNQYMPIVYPRSTSPDGRG